MRGITPMVAVLAAAAAMAPAAGARADDGDGVYGRFDGDLVLSVGAGAGWESDAGAVWLAEVRARYLDAAGLVLAPELHGSSVRLIAAVDVRPLFPLRFLMNQWSGRAFVDLLVDSIGVEVGAAFHGLTGGAEAGVALALGFGLDVPLVLPGDLADGLSLRLGARHVRASRQDLRAPEGGLSDWTLYAALTLRGITSIGLASRELPRYRPVLR